MTHIGSAKEKEKDKDPMTDAVKNGDDICVYSINISRMRILKNKLSLLELHRYIYARQVSTRRLSSSLRETHGRFMAGIDVFLDSLAAPRAVRTEFAHIHSLCL